MNFDLKKPCSNCPFRMIRKTEKWLGEARAKGIVEDLLQDKTFSCHKTTQHDDDSEYVPTSDEQHCAGALILLEKIDRPNQMMRIAERIRIYDRSALSLDNNDVADLPEQFISHHKK